MPTIVFVSPKGGVGKTTAALLLASELARAAPGRFEKLWRLAA
jgi:ATPases involved in chromosome partitioning